MIGVKIGLFASCTKCVRSMISLHLLRRGALTSFVPHPSEGLHSETHSGRAIDELHTPRQQHRSFTPGQIHTGGHWRVENNRHNIKDRWRDEDRHWSCRPGLAERLVVLLNAALDVLRLPGAFDEKLPIRARADLLCWDPAAALRLVGVR
jgi:hypothetical protein